MRGDPISRALALCLLLAGSPALALDDADNDGLEASADNCTLVANTDQRDTDGDGYGNRCDPDLNHDGLVGFPDLSMFRAALGTSSANADFDGNGIVSFSDLAILRGMFGKPPGPSGSTGYSIAATPDHVEFAGAQGSPLPPGREVTVDFVGDRLQVGWLPGAGQPGWLNVYPLTSPSVSPVTLRIELAPASFTPSLYATTVRLVTGSAEGAVVVYRNIPVQFDYVEPFSLTRTAVAVQSEAGEPSDTRSFAIRGTRLDWTITPDQPWLRVSAQSGTSAASIAVSADPTGLAAGTYTGQLLVTDAVSGSSATVNVTFGITQNRWNVSRIGMQFVAFADHAPGPEQVRVTDDFGVGLPWTATADVPWLTVTPGGMSGDSLVVQPNAAATALAAGMAHIATVTVAGAGLPTDSVRVGYYRSGSTSPNELHAIIPLGFATQPPSIVLDPVRPFAYVALGESTIYRVHLVTGVVVEVANDEGRRYVSPVVSGDGRTLFAYDMTSGTIVRYSIPGNMPLAPLPRVQQCCALVDHGFAWLRQRGQAVLVTMNLHVIDPDTGAVFQHVTVQPREDYTHFPAVDFFRRILVAEDGKRLFFYTPPGGALDSTTTYELTARPAARDGFLTLTGGSAWSPPDEPCCVLIREYARAADSDTVYLLGTYGGSTNNRVFRFGESSWAVISEENNAQFAIARSGVGAAVRRDEFGFYWRPYVFYADDTVTGNLPPYLSQVEDLEFSMDSRYLLILGTEMSQGLHLYRVP
jgi:hypothetical protein